MKIQEATHASRANAVVTYDANVAAIATLIHCARAGIWSDFGIRCCGRGAQRDGGSARYYRCRTDEGLPWFRVDDKCLDSYITIYAYVSHEPV